MDGFLRALPYLLVMLAAVPVFGLLATGSWRAAWAYTKVWFSSIALLVVVGLLLHLVLP